VVTYLGKANVALSVVLTTVSTFLAAFMTPLMTKTLAGTIVPVDAIGLAKSTASVVLAPVIVGLLAKRFVPKLVRVVAPFCPLVAVATVALICASIIGSSASAILAAGPALLLAVTTLHSLGFFLGYFFSKTLGFAEKDRRTVSIEVGMQNSALGVVLATAHFADPLVAVPCAISATVHSCVGSLVAGAWRLADQRKEQRATRGGR
jgi:BASS family bile acid:Na+ symporter